MPRVFVSDAIGADRLVGAAPPPGTRESQTGESRLAGLYRASLVAAGRTVERVLRPEIYQTEIARRILGIAPGDWHLCVKPLAHIRPFHGLANVFVADWPWPDAAAGPFRDPLRQLLSADAVICGTDATAGHLRAAGLACVLTLPPHRPSTDDAGSGLAAFRDGLVRLEALLARRRT